MIRDTRWLLAFLTVALVAASSANCATDTVDPPGDEPPADDTSSGVDSVADDASASFQWWTSCGDPVCSGHQPSPDVPACVDQVEGEACADGDATCDPGNDCNMHLVCAAETPAVQCPISLKNAKRDIEYLTAAQLKEVRAKVLEMPLATWHYKRDHRDRPLRLGFIIEDVQPAPSIDAGGGRVDLYGYASMAVAAIQAQDKEIQDLRARLEAVRAEVDRLTSRTAGR